MRHALTLALALLLTGCYAHHSYSGQSWHGAQKHADHIEHIERRAPRVLPCREIYDICPKHGLSHYQ
jgi:hypothetical protein